MRQTAVPLSKKSSPWSKDHCNFLLDRIDTQLSSLQGSSGPRIKGSSWDAPQGLGEIEVTSRRADPGRTNAGGDRDVSSREMDCRGDGLLHLPDSKETPSRSESICTEDLAAEFHKGLVDLLLSSDEDEAPSGLSSGPRDVRPPTSSATVLSKMAVPGPTLRSLHPVSDPLRSEPTSKQVPAEASVEKQSQELSPRSRGGPLQSLTQHGVKNMASLGEKRSARRQNCSAKSSSGTDIGRGGQPWKRNHHAKLQSSREEEAVSRKSGFLELERGGKELERSSEPRQNITRSSKYRLVVGDPLSSWQRARRTTSKNRVPPRRAEVSHPEKTSSDHPGGEPLGGCCRNHLLPLDGEDQGFLLPRCLYPPKAELLGGKASLSPSGLGTDPGIVHGPRDAQKTPGLARRLREAWVVASSPEVHGEIPERRETVGHNVKMKSLLPPSDPWRSSSSSISDADEEGFAQLTGQSRRTSGNFRRWAPNWKEATAGNYKLNQHMALELENFQEALQERQELARRLELQMEEHQDKVEKARADLILLEYKREICLKEVVELEQELSILRRQGRQYGALQVEVSRLVSEREELRDQTRCLEDQLSSLKLQLKSSRARLSSVEEMASEKTEQFQKALLSRKDLEIARMHETLVGLEAEKEALDGIVRHLKEEKQHQLKQLQQEASLEKEKELCQLREEMELQQKQALEECAETSEVAKASALREQAATFQKEIESLQKILKEREAEAIQQQEAMKKQAVALKVEAKEMVQNTLLQEQKKWETNAQAALQMQREVLGEQDRRRRADLQRALEKERKLNGALRNETADLRQKIEGLENQTRLLEQEKQASLEGLQVGLQKEKDEALQRLREELEQERMQEREEMKMKLQQMEEGEKHLQAECSRMSLREQEAQAQADRMDLFWATQITLACQQLQELLPEKETLLPHLLCRGALPLSSVAALQALREMTEEIQSYIQDLNRELESQRQRIFQIQREKEVELRQQKEQLHLESQSILEALKEQLVQEHMTDILALQRSWLKEGQEKDKPRWGPSPEERVGELRAAQKKVTCGEADHTPVNQPKEELDLEPEGRLTSSSCKNLATPGSEGRHFSTKWSQCHPSGMLCSPSLGTRRSLLPNPGLRHHLQNRIRKLRAENGGYWGAQSGHPRELPQSLVN
ncbi:uncharacterized protein LOC131185500 [Ahaetulla prasina]|uniref:uncharacterized protein LOC131185500 n=1 Tax=Ahaetulla prasina TaxID=499056 RepID=UPI0026485B4C|nr:uncharacterized protein LOC131185500 [Ahaetulla prasina]